MLHSCCFSYIFMFKCSEPLPGEVLLFSTAAIIYCFFLLFSFYLTFKCFYLWLFFLLTEERVFNFPFITDLLRMNSLFLFLNVFISSHLKIAILKLEIALFLWYVLFTYHKIYLLLHLIFSCFLYF